MPTCHLPHLQLAMHAQPVQLAQLAREVMMPVTTVPALQVIKFFSAVWAHIIVFLRHLVLRVRTFTGANDQSADMRNSAPYSSM